MSSTEHHSAASHNWLVFFFVCFGIIMAIGVWAIFCYNVDAPEPHPGGGGGHGMLLPEEISPQTRASIA